MCNEATDTEVSFNDIFEYCEQNFGEYAKIERVGELNKAHILGILPNYIDNVSYFLVRNDRNGRFRIEFHIKNESDTKLETAVKGWKDIPICKDVEYDPNGFDDNKGKLFIICDYSEGVEKLYSYIKEFTCRINCRIKDLYKSP